MLWLYNTSAFCINLHTVIQSVAVVLCLSGNVYIGIMCMIILYTSYHIIYYLYDKNKLQSVLVYNILFNIIPRYAIM